MIQQLAAAPMAVVDRRLAHVRSRYGLTSIHEAVQREDLFERLDAGLERRLTVVTGAPGSGKTTLVTTWLAARARGSVAWISLEPSDGSLARFWSEFIELVRAAASGPLPSLPEPGDDGFETALADACRELPEPVIMVLDDFERVRSPRVTESLDRLLHAPRTQLHLIIASRRDPWLSLPRLRLGGQLNEIRSSDLAFTREQAKELLTRAGVTLTDDQVRKLHYRTEGWVGGLRLAALSLAGDPDPEAFVRSFAGDERTIADYLVAEVLHQQPAPIREFMLRTSVVDELEPDLVNALTGGEYGAQTLQLLERSNAFLMPLDSRRQRYRYHAMFGELLRTELKYRMPDAFRLQHRRAARWYAAHGRPVSAVRHAVAAGDEVAATELLADRWHALAVQGHGHQLAAWIDGLPQQLVVESAELAVAGAGAALREGDMEKASGYLELADARAGSVASKRRARYALSRSIAAMTQARLRGDYGSACIAAHKVLAAHQQADLPNAARAEAQLSIGVAESWSADPAGIRRIEDALELARRSSAGVVVVDCMSQLALFKALDGSLAASESLARGAVSIAIDQGWDEHLLTAPGYLAMAITDFNHGAIEPCEAHLGRAQRAVNAGHERSCRCLIDLFRAQLASFTDLGEAIGLAHAIRQESAAWEMPAVLAASATFLEATFCAQAGRHDRAWATLRSGELAQRAPVEHAIVTARIALAAGQPARALSHLESERARTARALHPSTRIETIALSAVCKHQLRDDADALGLLEASLQLAQPERCRMPLLKIGPPLRELLKRRIRAGTAYRSLAGELIDGLDDGAHAPSPSASVLLLDPLSDREETVLRYLPTVMSKAEIASELFVSVNTVKTHTKNIYRKLGVGTRTEAVRRARNLNLV
jgi:LuxR family maltose regulon positive regulatory protein